MPSGILFSSSGSALFASAGLSRPSHWRLDARLCPASNAPRHTASQLSWVAPHNPFRSIAPGEPSSGSLRASSSSSSLARGIAGADGESGGAHPGGGPSPPRSPRTRRAPPQPGGLSAFPTRKPRRPKMEPSHNLIAGRRYCEECLSLEAAGLLEKATRASYGPVGGPELRCSKHKVEGDVNLSGAMCIVCRDGGIHTRAVYAQPGKRRSEVCFAHKRDGDIDVASPRCEHPGEPCPRHPSFGPRDGRPQFCVDHKLPGNVNLVYIRRLVKAKGLAAPAALDPSAKKT